MRMPRPLSYFLYFLVLAFCFTTIFIGYDLLLFSFLPEEDEALERESIHFLIQSWLIAGPALGLLCVVVQVAYRWHFSRAYTQSALHPNRLTLDTKAWQRFVETKTLNIFNREVPFSASEDGILEGRMPASPWAPRWMKVVLVPLKEQDGQMVVRIEPPLWMPDYSGFSIRTHHLLTQAFVQTV